MYATEKHLKMEAKELRETINELASDLGGDIRYLHSIFVELQASVDMLAKQIEFLNEAKNNE